MSCAGMFAVSLYIIFVGGNYDELIARRLPVGANLKTYTSAGATPEMASAVNTAKAAAGPEIINVTLAIPIILIVAFLFLNIYMRRKKRFAPACNSIGKCNHLAKAYRLVLTDNELIFTNIKVFRIV